MLSKDMSCAMGYRAPNYGYSEIILSLYSYCFNFKWRHVGRTALAPQGASNPAKCPHILDLLIAIMREYEANYQC